MDEDDRQLFIRVAGQVSVSVTPPLCTSATDGQYRASSAVSLGVNVPVPEDVQRPSVAPAPSVPPNPAVLLGAMIVWLAPALAVAAGSMVIVIDALAGPQGASWP